MYEGVREASIIWYYERFDGIEFTLESTSILNGHIHDIFCQFILTVVSRKFLCTGVDELYILPSPHFHDKFDNTNNAYVHIFITFFHHSDIFHFGFVVKMQISTI